MQSTILISNYSNDQIPAEYVFSDKQPGTGYYNKQDGTHTVVYEFAEFSGTVKIQATLSLYPGETDWFDVPDSIIGGDSSVIGTLITSKIFSGNFVWIRAAFQLDQGTILQIRYLI